MKKTFLFAIVSLFVFSFTHSHLVFAESEERIAPVEVVEVVNFSGTIKIIYSDGTTFVVKTGDDLPPLKSGMSIQVIDGTLTLRVGENTHFYRTGELVRIAEDANGNWEAFISPGDTGTKTLTSTIGDEAEGETAREIDSDAISAEIEEGAEYLTSVSPSEL